MKTPFEDVLKRESPPIEYKTLIARKQIEEEMQNTISTLKQLAEQHRATFKQPIYFTGTTKE